MLLVGLHLRRLARGRHRHSVSNCSKAGSTRQARASAAACKQISTSRVLDERAPRLLPHQSQHIRTGCEGGRVWKGYGGRSPPHSVATHTRPYQQEDRAGREGKKEYQWLVEASNEGAANRSELQVQETQSQSDRPGGEVEQNN